MLIFNEVDKTLIRFWPPVMAYVPIDGEFPTWSKIVRFKTLGFCGSIKC